MRRLERLRAGAHGRQFITLVEPSDGQELAEHSFTAALHFSMAVQELKDVDGEIRRCGRGVFIRVLLWWLGGSVSERRALSAMGEDYLVDAGYLSAQSVWVSDGRVVGGAGSRDACGLTDDSPLHTLLLACTNTSVFKTSMIKMLTVMAGMS